MREKFQNNLDNVIQTIEDYRLQVSKHHIVSLVAVSKYSTANDIENMFYAGQRAFGENKIQDLKEKSEKLEHLPIAWHFIGHLQKNKINQLIDLNPFLFQSLDSLELAKALNQRLEIKNKSMNVLLQINSAKEDTKGGVMPEVAIDVYNTIQKEYPNIKLKGVMSIGANTDNKEKIDESFKITNKIFEDLKPNGATICSMGMSQDFNLAILNGSTMIRVGSKLFK